MRTLMSEAVWVHYGQLYVQSGEGGPDLAECFGGQGNGLCGAAVPGILFLITGLHTGEVGFTVELHDAPPPADDSWQEIVEASFRPAGEVALVGWGGQGCWPLDLAEASYRARYCAAGMDEAKELDTRMEDDPQADHYLLQLWPASPEPDRVIKETSQVAAYWHGFAREQPPPPAPAEKAAAALRARAERERMAELASAEAEIQRRGDRLPSERLRDADGNARNVAQLDRSLVHALGETDPLTQRKLACWATRRAFAEAQLTDIDWISAALDALWNAAAAFGRGRYEVLFREARQAFPVLAGP
jgi:hypothetical protein